MKPRSGASWFAPATSRRSNRPPISSPPGNPMHRPPNDPPDYPPDASRERRRKFLKQIATGAAAGTLAFPVWAQEGASAVPPATTATQPPLAETLARYAARLRYDELAPEVVRETKRYLIDSIGCGLRG